MTQRVRQRDVNCSVLKKSNKTNSKNQKINNSLKNNNISGENITINNDIHANSNWRSNTEICFWIFIGVCISIIVSLVTFLSLIKYYDSVPNIVNFSLQNEILLLQKENLLLQNKLLETQLEKKLNLDEI